MKPLDDPEAFPLVPRPFALVEDEARIRPAAGRIGAFLEKGPG
jgi:hypothetical protein